MTYIETSCNAGFDYALSILTTPTPAQTWLASLTVPLPDALKICELCGTDNCHDNHFCPRCGQGRYPCRCYDESPIHCDMDAYKRYRDVYGEEEG